MPGNISSRFEPDFSTAPWPAGQYEQYRQYNTSYNAIGEEADWRVQPQHFRDGGLSAAQAAAVNVVEGAVTYISNSTGIGRRESAQEREVNYERDAKTVGRLKQWLDKVPLEARDMPVSELGIKMLEADQDPFRIAIEQHHHAEKPSMNHALTKRTLQDHTPRELVAVAERILAGEKAHDILHVPAPAPDGSEIDPKARQATANL